jgi:predicted thioesterase
MEGVEVGLVYEDRMVVGPGQAASLLIPGLPEVLATASLVAFVQLAAAKAVARHLKSGQGTVGTKITMAQLASTPVGMEIRAVVRLGGVNDRKLTFTFEVFDAVEKICEGIHERYIVDIEWLKRRIEQKLQKVS